MSAEFEEIQATFFEECAERLASGQKPRPEPPSYPRVRGTVVPGDGSIALTLDIDALVSSAGQLLQKLPLKGLAA